MGCCKADTTKAKRFLARFTIECESGLLTNERLVALRYGLLLGNLNRCAKLLPGYILEYVS